LSNKVEDKSSKPKAITGYNSRIITNDFLFAQYKELEPEEETAEIERIANELLSAKDEVEIRDVLIYDLLFEAMKHNLDDWPPP